MWGGLGGLRRGPVDGDLIAGARGVRRFDGAIVEEDMTVSDEALNHAAGDRRQAFAQVSVETLVRSGLLDRQLGLTLDFGSHCQSARPTPRMTRLKS